MIPCHATVLCITRRPEHLDTSDDAEIAAEARENAADDEEKQGSDVGGQGGHLYYF